MFKKNIYILIILIPICISLIFIEIDEIALQISIIILSLAIIYFSSDPIVSGIVQSIMLIFPIISFFVEINLDGYILYQFLAIAVTLWLVKKAIVDDGKLTLDEGIFILLAHLMGIILFDELTRI